MKKAIKFLFEKGICGDRKKNRFLTVVWAFTLIALSTILSNIQAQNIKPRFCYSQEFNFEKEIVVDPGLPYPQLIESSYRPMGGCDGVYPAVLHVNFIGSNVDDGKAFPITLIYKQYGKSIPDTIVVFKDTVFNFKPYDWEFIEGEREMDSYRPYDVLYAIDATGCFRDNADVGGENNYKNFTGDGWVVNRRKKWGRLELENGAKDTTICDNTAVKINFQRADYNKKPSSGQMLSWFYYEKNGVLDSLFTNIGSHADTFAHPWDPAWITFDSITDTTVIKLLYVKSGFSWLSGQGYIDWQGDMKNDVMKYVWRNRDDICYWPDRPDSIIIYPYHQDMTTTVLVDTVCPQNRIDNFVGKGELPLLAIHSESEFFPITGKLREAGVRGYDTTVYKEFDMYSPDTIITGVWGVDRKRYYSAISWIDPLGCVPLPYPDPDSSMSRPAASLEWKKYAGYSPDTSVCIGEEAFATLNMSGVFPIKTSFSFGKRTGGAGGILHGGGTWEYEHHEFSWGEFIHKDHIGERDTVFYTEALSQLGAVSRAWNAADTLIDGNGCVYHNGLQDSVSAVLVGEPNIIVTSPDSSYCYMQTVPIMLHYYDSSDHFPETRKYEIEYQIKGEPVQTKIIKSDDTSFNIVVTDSTWIRFISLKSQFGCSKTLTDTVFLPMKSSLFVNLSKDTAVCIGEEARITATVTHQHNKTGPWLLEFSSNLQNSPNIQTGTYSVKTGDTTFIVLEALNTRYFASIYDGFGCVQYSDTVLVSRNPLPVAKTTIPSPPQLGVESILDRSPSLCSYDTTSLFINFLTGTPPFEVAWQSNKGQTGSAKGINGDTAITVQPINLVSFTVDGQGWANATTLENFSDLMYYTLPYIKDGNGCVSSNDDPSSNGNVTVIRAVDSVYDLIPWDTLNQCQTALPLAGIPLNYRHSGYWFDIKISIHSEKGFVKDTWCSFTYRWNGMNFKIPTNDNDFYRITVDSIRIEAPMARDNKAQFVYQKCPYPVSKSKVHVVAVREYPHLIMPADTFVCEGSEIPLRMEFDKGLPPYKVTYKEDASTLIRTFTTRDTTITYAPDTIKRYKLLSIANDFCTVNYNDSAKTTTTIDVGQTSVSTVFVSRKDTTICPAAAYRLITRTSGGAGPWTVVMRVDSSGSFTYDTVTTLANGIANVVLDNLTADSTRYTIVEMWDKDSCVVAGTGQSVIIRRRPEIRAVITSNDTSVCRMVSIPVNISLEGGNETWQKMGQTAWTTTVKRNTATIGTYTIKTGTDTTVMVSFPTSGMGSPFSITVSSTIDKAYGCVSAATDTMRVAVEQNMTIKVGNPEGVTVCEDFEGGVRVLKNTSDALYPWRFAYRETNLGTSMSSNGLAPGASRIDTLWSYTAADTTFMFSPDTTTKYALLGYGTEKCFYARTGNLDSTSIISVAPPPTVEIQSDTAMCNPAKVGLRAKIINGQAPFKIYYDVFQNGITTKDSTTVPSRNSRITRQFTADTTIIKVTGIIDKLGCETTEITGQQAKVVIHARKKVIITTPDTFICRYETVPIRVSLTGGKPPYSFVLAEGASSFFEDTVQNTQDTVIHRYYSTGRVTPYPIIVKSVTDPLTGCVHTNTDTLLLSVERTVQRRWGGNSKDTICGGDTARLAVTLFPAAATELLPWRAVYRTDNLVTGESRIDTAYLSKIADTIRVSPENASRYTLVAHLTKQCNYSISTNADSITTVQIQERPFVEFVSDTEFCLRQNGTINLVATRGTFPITINYTHITKNGVTNYSYTSTSSTDTARFTNNMIYDNAPPWEENSYVRNKVVFTSANSNSSRFCSYKISDTFNYSIKNPGAKMTSLSSDTLCSSDTLKLKFSLTYGKTPWQPYVYIKDGMLNPLIYGTDTVINIIDNKAYTYSFIGLIDGDGCEGIPNNINYRDTLKVNEYETPMAWIEGDTAVYPNKQIHLHIKLKKGKYPYTVKIGFAPSTTVITGSPYYTFSAYSDTTITVSAGSETGFFKIMEVIDGQGCENKSSDEFRYAFVNIYQKFSAKIATGSGYNGLIAGAAGKDTTVCYGETVGLRVGFTNGVRPLTVNFVDSTGGTYSFVCNFDTTVLFSAKTKTSVYTLSSVIDGTGEPADLGLDSTVGLRMFERATFSILSDVSICKGDTAELAFNITNSKAPYRLGYRIDNGGELFINVLKDTVIKTIRNTSATYNAVSVKDGFGCFGMVHAEENSAKITVREEPTATLAGDTAVCKNEESGLKFIFTGDAPLTASLSNGLKFTVYNNDTTLYKARDESIGYSLASVTDAYGCEANILKKDVNIEVWDVPSISITGDTLICPGFEAPLNITLHKGQAPFKIEYENSKTGGTTLLSVSEDTTLNLKAIEDITYTLISFNDLNGCAGEINEEINEESSVEITLHSKPTIAMTGDTTVCKNTETSLGFIVQNGLSPYTVLYKNDKTGTESFVLSGKDTNLTKARIESTLYTLVKITDSNECIGEVEADSSAEITVLELPGATLKGDTSVCEDISTKLYFAVQSGKSPYNIFYKDKNENTESFILYGTDTILITANNEDNLYTLVQITDSNKCVSASATNNTANITVYDRPSAWFTGDTSVCSGDNAFGALNFSGGEAPYTYIYKDKNELSYSNVSSESVYNILNQVFDTITYDLISVKDINNCWAEIGETDSSLIHTAWQRPTAAIEGDTSICKDEISGIKFSFTGDKPFTATFLSGETQSQVIAQKDTTLYDARSENITYSLVSIIDTHGCEGSFVPSVNVASIEVWAVPQASLSKDTSVCPDALTPIDIKFHAGRTPFTIEYKDNKNEEITTLSVSKDTTLIFNASGNITYTLVSLSDKGGCVGVPAENNSAEITLYSNPSISLKGDTAVCKDVTVPLFFTAQNGTSPYTVHYKNNKGLTSDFKLSGNDTVLSTGHDITTLYTVTSIEDKNGCISIVDSKDSTANIVVFEQAELSLEGDTAVCKDAVTPLRFNVKNGTSPYIISYKNDKEEVESFKLYGTDTVLKAARIENVLYTVVSIEDSNSCKGIISAENSTANISIYSPVSVGITGDTTVCKNTRTPLRFTTQNGTSPYTISYKNDNGEMESFNLYGTDTTLIAARVESKNYIITEIIDRNGCTGIPEEEDTVKITVNELPDVKLKGDTTVCLNDSILLGFDFENGTAPYKVLYRNIDGVQINFTAKQDTFVKHAITKTNRFNLISLSDSNGCAGVITGSNVVEINTHVLTYGYVYGNDEVCEGTPTDISFVFQTGEAPYTATYTDDSNKIYTITTYQHDTNLREERQESISYTLTKIQDKNGCTGSIMSDKASIIVHKAARAAMLGDTSVCEGEETSVTIEFLTGDAPFVVYYINDMGEWLDAYSEDGSPIVFTEERNKSMSYSIVSVESYAEFWCPLPQDEPEPDHTAEIEVYPRATASIFGDTTICRGSESPLSFDFKNGIAPYIISYIDNKGGTHKLTAYQDTTLVGVRNEDIVYEATALESFDKCSGTISPQNQATIITRNLPAVSLIGDTAVCEGISTNITFNITESSKPYAVSYKDNKGGDYSFQTENLQEIFTAERFDSIDYTLTGISDIHNCVGSVLKDSMAKIAVYPRPHITDFSGDTAVCTSADLPLLVAVSGGLPPYILELNGVDTLRLHGTDTSVVNRETGSKKYILTHSIDMRGCYGIIDGSDSVIMNVWGTPPALIKGEDTSVCKGSEVPIDFKFGTGAPPFVITYKNDREEQGEIKTYGDTAIIITIDETTKYTLLDVVDSNHCHAEIFEDSTRVVTVYSTPVVAVLGDTTVCNEAAVPITFVSSDASVESYIVYNYNDVAFADTFTGSKTITDTLTGRREYKLISYFEEHGCEGLISGDSNIAFVQAYGIPVVNIYGDTSVCPLAPASLRIGFENGVAPYTVTLNSGNLTYSGVGGELNGDTSLIVEWAATDSIMLKALTDSKGCIGVIGADSIAAVNIFETPIGWIEGDTSVCFGDTALVSLFFDKGKAPYTADINGITYSVLNDTVIKYRIMADESPFALLSLSDSNNCAGNVIADSNFAVSVYEKPVVSISGDTGANYGTIVPVGIAVAGGASPYTITSEPFGTIILNANDTTILDIADVTHYDIVKSVVEMHGCAGEVSDKDSITVTVNSVWATIDGDTAICLGEGTTMYFSCERYSPWMLYLRDSTAGTWQQYTIYGSDTAIIVYPQATTVFYIDSIQNSAGNSNVLYIDRQASVEVFPIPTAVIGNDTAVCLGQSAKITMKFTGTAPWTVWIQDGTGTGTQEFFNKTIIRTLAPTNDAKLQITAIEDDNGCRNDTISYKNEVTVKVHALPQIKFLGDTAVCEGTETPLNITKTAGTSPLVLHGNKGSLKFYGADTVLRGARLVSDTFKITQIIDSNGCVRDINDSVKITVFSTPVASIYGDTSVCPLSETPVQIEFANGKAPYTATLSIGTFSFLQDSSLIVVRAATDSITLKSFIDSNGCAGIIGADSIVKINVFETPEAWIKGDTSICYSDTAFVSLFFDKGRAPYKAVINGVEYIASEDTILKYKITADSRFTLESLSDYNNCTGLVLSDSNTVDIISYDLPTVSLTKDTTICMGDEGSINVSFTGESPYQFNYVLDGLEQSRKVENDTTFTVVVNDTVLMKFLQVTDAHTCAGFPFTKDSVVKITPQPLPKITLAKDTTLCLDGITEVPLNIFMSGVAPVFTTIAQRTANTTNIDTLWLGKDTTLILKPVETTKYTVLYAKDEMCYNTSPSSKPGSDSIEVTFVSKTKPTASLSNDTAICAEKTVKVRFDFTGEAPWKLKYKIKTADGTENIETIEGITSPKYEPSITPSQTITYRILGISDNICQDLSSGDSLTITLNALPTAKISGGKIYCTEAEATELKLDFTGKKPFKMLYTENNGMPKTAFSALDALSGTINVKPATTTLFAIHSVIDGNGCEAKAPLDTTTVTVLPQPSVALTKDTSVCHGETVLLNLRVKNTPAPYQLTTIPFGKITVRKDTVFAIKPGTSQSYEITQIKDANGCVNDTLKRAKVAVTVWQRPAAAFVTKDTTLCPEGTAIISTALTGTQPYEITYIIAGKDSVMRAVAGTGKTFTLSPQNTTDISIKEIIDVHGCNTLPVGQNIVITMHALPTISIKGDSAFCDYGWSVPARINLGGTPPFTVQYKTMEGTDAQSFSAKVNRADTAFVFKPEQNMSVELVHVSDKICSTPATGNISFTVRPLPVAKIFDLDQICKDDSTELSFALEEGTPPYSLQYEANGIKREVTGIAQSPYNVWQSPKTTTNYTLLKVNDLYCENIAFAERKTGTIIVWNRPGAVITGDTSVCEGVESAKLYFPTTAYPPFIITYRDENTGSVFSKRFTSLTPTPYTDVNFGVQTTKYKLLKIEDSVCVSEKFTDSVATITVMDAPEVELLTPDTSVCRGSNFDMRLKIVGGTAPFIVSYLINGKEHEKTGIYGERENITFRADTTINILVARVRDKNCFNRFDAMHEARIDYRVLPTASLLNTDTTVCPNMPIRLMFGLTGAFPLAITYSAGDEIKIEKDIDRNTHGVNVKVPETATRYRLTKIQDAYCENTAFGSIYADLYEYPQILKEPQEIFYGEGEEIWFEMEAAGDIIEYQVIGNNKLIGTYDDPRFSLPNADIDDRGYYNFIVKGICGDTSSIIVKAIFELDASLIHQKWNNLLIMSNVPYKFVDGAYQWYRNDIPLDGNHKAFHSAGPNATDLLDFNAWYKVRVVMVANGDTFFTRKMMPEKQNDMIIFAAPNPVSMGTFIDVGVGKESLSHDAVIDIFDAQGKRINSVIVPAGEAKKRIYLNNYKPGLYFFKITEGDNMSAINSSNGVFLPSGLLTRTLKVIVTK